MQTYALRMFNFLRFGEKGNSIVFDLTPQEKKDLKSGIVTMDQIYDRAMKNPVQHVIEVKRRGMERLLAISGIVDGNQEFSNGSGKSSLLEGMCYTRYERIVRRTAQNPDRVEKAGLSVVTKIDGKYPPNLKESWVEELCEIGNNIYRIRRGKEFTRSQKNHSPIMELECLYESSTDSRMSHRTGDTKNNLDEILTMDYDLFVNSQMFGQNDAGKYLIGTDKTKKEMLISLLHLEAIVSGCLENIRKKKSNQDKKLETVKATIAIIENGFCKKYIDLVNGICPVFEDKMIPEILNILNDAKTNCVEDCKEFDKEIHLLDGIIDDLLKSEKLLKVESIKVEGRHIQKDKKAKEEVMATQVSEWEKLERECNYSIVKKSEQIELQTSKQKKIFEQISLRENFIKNFNLVTHQEQIKKIQKAKDIRPQITNKLIQARKVYTEVSNKMAVLNSDLSKLNIEENKLQLQIKKIGTNGSFICIECKSVVSEEHIKSKIKAYQEDIVSCTNSVNACKEEVGKRKIEISDLESKENKINEILLSEGNILESLKTFEDSKTRLIELETQLKEYSESFAYLNNEKSELEKQRSNYSKKIIEIKNSFASEIEGLKIKIESLVTQLRQAEKDAEVVNTQLNECRKNRKDLEDKKNKSFEKHGSICKEYEHLEKQQNELDEKCKQFVEDTKTMNRILLLEDIYGLDGIQTRIVRKYLPLLNIYIKEFLDILSDGQMVIKMLINDKSKVDMIISGGTSDTYEMLSGGEKTIVRLAVDIGLSLLAFSRTTQKPEMICLDEIFGSLDAGRTKNVFKVLNKLSDKFSRIIIISHDVDINNQIKNRIIIEKSGGRMGLSEIKRIE